MDRVEVRCMESLEESESELDIEVCFDDVYTIGKPVSDSAVLQDGRESIFSSRCLFFSVIAWKWKPRESSFGYQLAHQQAIFC